jgi:hypothetical protein
VAVTSISAPGLGQHDRVGGLEGDRGLRDVVDLDLGVVGPARVVPDDVGVVLGGVAEHGRVAAVDAGPGQHQLTGDGGRPGVGEHEEGLPDGLEALFDLELPELDRADGLAVDGGRPRGAAVVDQPVDG